MIAPGKSRSFAECPLSSRTGQPIGAGELMEELLCIIPGRSVLVDRQNASRRHRL